MASLSFTIEGNPVAKGRPRFTTLKLRDGTTTVRTYTPKETENYEDVVRWHALEARNALRLPLLYETALELSVDCYLAVPRSWSQVKQRAALRGLVRPLGRPDWDNLVKLVADALNGTVYRDDSAIWRATVSKTYAEIARTEIKLTWDAADSPPMIAADPKAPQLPFLPMPTAERISADDDQPPF